MPGALVTGASRGIGAACAIALANAGYDVAVGYVRDADGAAATAATCQAAGVNAFTQQVDVADAQSAAAFVAAAEEAFGSLDAVVLNAGITKDGLAMRMSVDDWQSVIRTNLDGAFWTAKAALRGMMKARSGSIVAISSVIGLGGNAGQANYAAAKAGMIGMAKSLAKEVGSRGIRVNVVAPGYIETDMTADLADDVKAKLLDGLPLARLGSAQDVAAVVAFLCSPAAAYMTGAVLPVDGGMAM